MAEFCKANPMIAIQDLSLAYGQKLLFCDVNLNLNTGKSYALVGANGTGKSSFFKLMTGEEEASLGAVQIPKEASLGWLKQDQFRYEETPIQEIVIQGNKALWQAMLDKEALFLQTDWDEAQSFRLAALEEIIMQEGGYSASNRASAILVGLGIPEEYHLEPLKCLSGGYKLRVLLAQCLFQNPSILLLDEPTNHLDIVSIQWLEKFLKNEFKGLLIFISHDQDFIDHLADHILDIDFGEVRKYSGRYHKFLAEKQLIQEQKQLEKKAAEEKIAHLQSFVDRFGAKASKAAQARSRAKMIEKIELPDILRSSRVAPHFQFKAARPSGKLVCKVQGLSKRFDSNVLFKNLNLEIHRGDRLAILGANGRGKSSLLKILMQQLQADEGDIQWGAELKISYFSQDHHELLNYSCRVLDWMQDVVAGVNEQQIRRALGQVLFSQDEVSKDILSLSGGEAARLLLAKLMLESPNLIILDEPTNHMDIETIEALGKALEQYTGTLLVVSHNRHFISQFANRILYYADNGKVLDFKGTLQEWQEKQDS